jgi:iron complex transport system substrate-binding protein
MIRTRILPVAACIGCILLFLPASAMSEVPIPQTPDEIHGFAQYILRDEILRYISSKYAGEDTTHLSAADLADAVPYYPEYPRRIIDSSGTTITIVRPLSRIVAINSHALGILDADDKVIAVSSSAIEGACLVPDLASKTDVGGGGPSEPDFEKILSLHPDAVLTYTQLGPGREFFEDRMPQGVPVIRLDFILPSTLTTEMKKLGYLLNCTERSSSYVDWHDGIMNEINQRLATIPENDRVRVFIDVWYMGYSGSGNERHTVSDSIYYSQSYCSDNGGINIAADLTNPQGTVDIEWLAQERPDVILGSAYHGGYAAENTSELKTQYDELANLQTLKDVPAIRDDRIYILSFRYIMGPSYPAARAQAVRWFYPDIFADINPVAIHQEYIDRFLGVPYNVSTQGAFIYPPG